jgi:cationic amino acid transporter-APC superfamily
MTYALSRMIYSLARDGLLPQSFKQVTKTSRVPKNATILTGVVSAIAAGIFPLASIAAFLNICTLAYLILLAYGIIKLRKDKGEPKEGEFKTPLVPFLPILSILICLSFMLQYTLETWIAFVLALAVGVIIYFTYGYKNSTLSKNQ